MPSDGPQNGAQADEELAAAFAVYKLGIRTFVGLLLAVFVVGGARVLSRLGGLLWRVLTDVGAGL